MAWSSLCGSFFPLGFDAPTWLMLIPFLIFYFLLEMYFFLSGGECKHAAYYTRLLIRSSRLRRSSLHIMYSHI